MSAIEILDTVRHDARAFDIDPVTYLLEEAASARRWGDYETARQALQQANTHNLLGEGPTLP